MVLEQVRYLFLNGNLAKYFLKDHVYSANKKAIIIIFGILIVIPFYMEMIMVVMFVKF
jgi:hypothetical protein